MTRRDYLGLTMPLAVILLLFLIWPAAFGFIASFTDYAPAQLSTRFVGLANYADVVENSEFSASVHNLVVFTLISVAGALVVGFILAYLLREPFRGRGPIRIVLLIPWLISPVANGVMWHFLYSRERGLFSFVLAWLGSPGMPSPLSMPDLALFAAALTEIWRQAPFVGFILLPGLVSIPTEQWEYAALEGTSMLDNIFQIALPWLRPLLLTVTLLLVGAALGNFENIVVMTGGGPGSRTTMLGLFSYHAAFGNDNWPVGATAAWFIVAAMALVGAIYVRLSQEGVGNHGRQWRPVDFLTDFHFPRLRLWPGGWRAQRIAGSARRALFVGLFIAVFTLPLLWSVLASFNIKPENVVSPPQWDVAWSLENYQEVGVTEPGFLEELLTSTNLAVAATLMTVVISFCAAYGVTRSHLQGKNALVQVFLVLASLPVMAYAIPLTATIRSLHLYDTFIGVTLAETAVLAPLAVYILAGYLAQMPREIEEAAYLDGAGPWRLVWSIVLPVTATGVAATAVIIFVLSWNQFLIPFILSTDQVRSIPMAMVDVFKWDRELEWSAVAAALVASVLPLLVLVTVGHRVLEDFRLRPSQTAG